MKTTKKHFIESVKAGKVYCYGYTTLKGLNKIKDENIKIKLNGKDPKKSSWYSFPNNFKDVVIESLQGFTVLTFKDTSNVALYKIKGERT